MDESERAGSLDSEERIRHHRSLAEAYHQAYLDQDAKDGATYDNWVFADDALYYSPYFGDDVINLKANPPERAGICPHGGPHLLAHAPRLEAARL